MTIREGEELGLVAHAAQAVAAERYESGAAVGGRLGEGLRDQQRMAELLAQQPRCARPR